MNSDRPHFDDLVGIAHRVARLADRDDIISRDSDCPELDVIVHVRRNARRRELAGVIGTEPDRTCLGQLIGIDPRKTGSRERAGIFRSDADGLHAHELGGIERP